MGALDHQIFPLSNLTRQTCLDMRRFPCCGDPVESVDNFRLDFFREGQEGDGDLLTTYDFFHVDESTGYLCVIWDDKIKEFCQGRYIGHIYYDCRLVGKIRFMLGSKPAIENVEMVESKIPLCFSNEIPMQCETLEEPDTCCEDECEPVDPCCRCVDNCGKCAKCLDEEENGD